jgi:membrane protease YdiL (CAAX protease family)
MDSNQIPPVISAPAVETAIARWRWWVHLLILSSFPLSAGVLGILMSHGRAALLPVSVPALEWVLARELIFFAGIFVVAWVFSRVNRRQLLLKWHGGALPVLWGGAYSVALRLLIMVLATTAIIFWVLFKKMLAGDHAPGLEHQVLRPQIEHLVDMNALTTNPVYFVLMLTVVSFVLGGLREELWRAAMFAGCSALFPRGMSTSAGKAVAIVAVAIVFGLGHTAQGWMGVGVITALGIGLGAIMLWHRSIWEAAMAHGFFDATTFVFIYAIVKYRPHQIPGL